MLIGFLMMMPYRLLNGEEDFEEPDLSQIINKLGFTVNLGGNDE